MIINPVILEVRRILNKQISVFSGEEFNGEKYNVWVCKSVMCCALKKQKLTRKKYIT